MKKIKNFLIKIIKLAEIFYYKSKSYYFYKKNKLKVGKSYLLYDGYNYIIGKLQKKETSEYIWGICSRLNLENDAYFLNFSSYVYVARVLGKDRDYFTYGIKKVREIEEPIDNLGNLVNQHNNLLWKNPKYCNYKDEERLVYLKGKIRSYL